MKLSDYKKKIGLTYIQIAEQLDIPRSTMHRLCDGRVGDIRLKQAKKIVEWSNGEVNYEDLL